MVVAIVLLLLVAWWRGFVVAPCWKSGVAVVRLGGKQAELKWRVEGDATEVLLTAGVCALVFDYKNSGLHGELFPYHLTPADLIRTYIERIVKSGGARITIPSKYETQETLKKPENCARWLPVGVVRSMVENMQKVVAPKRAALLLALEHAEGKRRIAPRAPAAAPRATTAPLPGAGGGKRGRREKELEQEHGQGPEQEQQQKRRQQGAARRAKLQLTTDEACALHARCMVLFDKGWFLGEVVSSRAVAEDDDGVVVAEKGNDATGGGGAARRCVLVV